MEVMRGRRSRAMENASPDRARVYVQPKLKPFTKVQVIYYLCRNGHLEHPHFMEVTHLASQYLRLKDVMERLTVLRGKGMPSLYSWSCKRSYKNGFVWSDLDENDVIHPCEGAEYVLKGSELIEGTCGGKKERFLHLKSNNAPQKIQRKYRESESDDEEEEEEEEDYFDEKRSNSSSNSTSNHNSSVFLQLIACGSSSRPIKAPPHQISNVGRKSNVNISSSCGDLHKEVLCKSAKNSGNCYNRSDEDDAMINCMSENPRFGNPQSEDKEYFSGSIVEAMAEEGRVLTESTLKKSSSYNQERSAKCGLAEEREGRGGGGESGERKMSSTEEIFFKTGKKVIV
ncbi:hypothetical protein Syun_013656 [Stephania yunnanensis]|uniref:SOSEKI DIX-like domain-containing protein n=1 Tax=Stephania yunnanensis TaxID=152371 RepID=A0AAP0JIY3_9MAGN